jgi:hypothetical protein
MWEDGLYRSISCPENESGLLCFVNKLLALTALPDVKYLGRIYSICGPRYALLRHTFLDMDVMCFV